MMWCKMGEMPFPSQGGGCSVAGAGGEGELQYVKVSKYQEIKYFNIKISNISGSCSVAGAGGGAGGGELQ